MNELNFPLTPEVSVILPTYNRAEHLTRCIESVINQTYQNWELIVVDDGSQDHTFDLVNKYLQKLPQIRYLKHQNRGAALSRNIGIKVSFGNYLTFIDSDDQYLPHHLQSRLNYFQNDPELELITGGFRSDQEIWVKDYYQPEKRINIQDCVICPTFFGKRYVFFELRGFKDIVYGEDTDLWERACQKFKVQKVTQDVTYIYTRAADSVSQGY